MYWSYNHFVIQCIIFCKLLHLPQTESLLGVNVRQAREGEFPYAVVISTINNHNNSVNFFCTGTLISSKHVLTAAHCLTNQENIHIFIGSRDVHRCTPYSIDSWKTYDIWASEKHITNKFTDNDIAIVTLSTKLDYRHDTLPDLFLRKTPTDPAAKPAIAGWSRTNNGSYNPILKTAIVNLLSKSECESKLSKIEGKHISIDESRFFCTAANPYVLGEHVNGDSGDPVINNNGLLGFLIKGFANAPKSDKVNLHIKIDYYNDFIRAMIKDTRFAK